MSEICNIPQSGTHSLASTKSRTRACYFVLAAGVVALYFSVLTATLVAQTPVIVPTWRYDQTHAGQNTNETALTVANVNVKTFGKLFSVKVDSSVYAQLLYVPGLTMHDGLVHNVFYVATENDSIYAFDADSNSGANTNPIWHITLLDAAHGAAPGATVVPSKDPAGGLSQGDIEPTIGITGTPVINPATNTMYVVGNTKENGVYISRLHAINIISGAEQNNSVVNTTPVVISATVPGTGLGSSGGKLSFNPLIQNQRSALDYYNGAVYIGYASHGDHGPWHGWLFAYDATSMQQTAVICLSPNDHGASVWGSGAGNPIDTDSPGGRMFVVTGNGGASENYPPFSGSTEYGESIINFSLANGGLTPTDAFTSFNVNTLNEHDMDQGSGGLLMVPDQQGPNAHVLVQAGKEGRILVLNRDSLGGFAAGASSNTNILQDIPKQVGGLWSTPAYWNGHVYTWGTGDVPKMFTMSNGVLGTTPSSKSTIKTSSRGATFSVSSNGTQNGIAWAVGTGESGTNGAAVLFAWDANSLTTPIYASDTNSARDSAGTANKFSIPMVTNGKVYMPAYKQVDVYGLFNAEPIVAAPVITPNGGTFPSSQSVQLSTATGTANIYYTLDGSTPTPGSTLYSDAITLDTDSTLRAIATAPGYVQSAIESAVFTFSDQTPAVTFKPVAGTYTSGQSVSLSDTDTDAAIYYTTDGSTPTASSNLFADNINVSANMTINAIAIDPSLTNSNVATAAYVIQPSGTSISFANGFTSVAGLSLNGTTVQANGTMLQLTNTSPHQKGSVFWSMPVGVQAFTTVFEFQLSQAHSDGFTFTLQNVGSKALGGGDAGLGYSGLKKSVAIKFDIYNNAGEGKDSTGFYTGGAMPTVPAVDMTGSGVMLNSGDPMQATVTYDGATLSMQLLDEVTGKTFTASKAIDIPSMVGAKSAYVGFTGTTGGSAAIQDILTWTYTAQ